jgi:porin
MDSRCTCYAVIALAVMTPLVSAGLDVSASESRLTLGATGTLDAAAGLSGVGQGSESLHGNVLGEASWAPSETAERPIAISGYASVLWVEGRGPSDRIVGDFLAASNSEAHQSLRLYSWWLEVTRGAWSLRTGALLADEEFAGTTPGASLINSSFGWPAFLSANTLNTGPAYYAAALGARLAWENDGDWSARAGVYDGDSYDSATGDDRPNRHGTRYQLNGEQGAFFIAEATYAPAAAANRFTAGAWAHTADFADPGTGAAREGNHGAYVIAGRTLRGVPGEPGNIEAHVRYGWAPDDRNTVAWAADTGIAATGLFPSRPADTLALGVAHARISPGLAGQDYERVIELGYAAPLTPRLTVQPDVQYIRHVGAAAAGGDAWLFLLRVQAAY